MFSRQLRNALIHSIATPLLLLALIGQARAGFTIMDQIGPNGSYLYGGNESQILGSSNSQFNNAFIDDFSISGSAAALSQVNAAVLGYNGFLGYSGVNYFQVSIYSSRAAAEGIGVDLRGDVFNYIATPGDYTVNTNFGSAANSALISIPINEVLGPGTYYISVIAGLDYPSGGQLAVYSSSFAGTPDGSNSFRINPSNGYNNGRDLPINTNAAYSIFANSVVPEPSSLLMLGIGVAGATWKFRRRRR